MDWSALADVHATAFAGRDRPWTANEISSLCALPGTILLHEGVPPAGFALVRVAADEAELLMLAVRPDRRREGLGAKLLIRAVDAARLAGAAALLLEVADGATAARALYAAAGFRQIGRRRDYLRRPDGGAEDAAILLRNLAPSV